MSQVMGVYSVSYTLDCLCNHESVKTLLCVFEIVVPFLMGGFDQKDLENDKCPNLWWRQLRKKCLSIISDRGEHGWGLALHMGG